MFDFSLISFGTLLACDGLTDTRTQEHCIHDGPIKTAPLSLSLLWYVDNKNMR